MNNIFDITRFGLLLKRQWLEFGKIFLISVAVALGILVAFYGAILWNSLIVIQSNGITISYTTITSAVISLRRSTIQVGI